MKNLVLATLLAAGLIQAGSGCIFTSDDDDDDIRDDDGDGDGDDGDDFTDIPIGGDHNSGGADGILWIPNWLCPPDAETITFFVTPVGASEGFADLYDCDDPNPDALAYDAGDYDIVALPEGSIGEFADLFDDTLGGPDGTLIDDIDFAFTQDGGFFDLAWTTDVCQPGDVVQVWAEEDPTDVIDYPCEDGVGLVPPDEVGWLIGDYAVNVVQLDETGAEVSVTTIIDPASIIFADELSPDLGTVDLVPL
jgi:hypothetical protein